MLPISIKKRDGRTVDFDHGRIENALTKACISIGQTETDFIPGVVNCVVQRLEAKYEGIENGETRVEEVQDLVEVCLMEANQFDVAKEYILYRHKAQEKREKSIVQKITKHALSVKKRDGSVVAFDIDQVKTTFEKAAKEHKDIINIEALIKAFRSNVYDGISTSDISKAMLMTCKSFIERDPAYSFVCTKLFLIGYYKEIGNIKMGSKSFRADYEQAFKDKLELMVKEDRLDKSVLDFDMDVICKALKPERDFILEERSISQLYDRYFIHVNKKKQELPQAFWMRIAMGLCAEESKEEKEKIAIDFYEVLSTLRFISSTPTLFHSGTKHPQFSSCYLTTVEDDLNHIFKSYGDNAQMSKWSGGLGNDWSNIRGTGAYIKATNVESQGVIPFLKIANDVTGAINRSGKRRGATCAYLESWHYDIEEFLDLRKNTGDERRRTHDMNTANWIPDLFMQRVIADEHWTLFSPDETPDLHHIYGAKFKQRYEHYEAEAANGNITLFKTIEAKNLWRKMISMLFETGHPWMTFKDPCNIRSPQDHAGVIHSSNLCTEITLNTSKEETAVCNLGSVYLNQHMKDGEMNWKQLEKTVQTGMRMLDNVININFYPTIEGKNSNLKHRPVGLGMSGLADALFMMNLPFDSDAAISFNDKVMEFISYHAIYGSSKLAKERGTYESYKGSKWDRGIFPVDTIDMLEKERGEAVIMDRNSHLDWTPVRDHVKKHGMRNSNTMAIAPTASTSNIGGSFPCIEPIYKNLYVKSNMSGEFTVINKYLVEDLKELNMWNSDMVQQLKYYDGSIQEIDGIPDHVKAKFKEVFEIDPIWVIRAASARAKWIDQSQSVNIFIKGASGKKISETYIDAWKHGLKTTYYLRTLGATSIEKSTLSNEKKVIATQAAPAPVKTPVSSEQESGQLKADNGKLTTESDKKVMCSILNGPDCESCQ